MWEYDYKIFKFKMHSEVIEMLNDAGNDNWEIVNYDEENPSNNVNSELPVFVHEEIVNIAVRKMLQDIQDIEGYQLKVGEINNQIQ